MSETGFNAPARITSDLAYLTLRHAVGREHGWLSILLKPASPVGYLALTPGQLWTVCLQPAIADRIKHAWSPPWCPTRDHARLLIPLYPLDTNMDSHVFCEEVEQALEGYKRRYAMPWSILALRG